MAAPKNRIYALNLGTQTITLAEFQTTPTGGVTLVRYRKGEILGDPAADPTRVAQTKLQIDSFSQEFGIKAPHKVNYAIASHVIFTRPVRLPAVGEASQVEQIVGFEAAQNVPYPIDQVVWDWQLLDEGKGGQMEVILAAIKSDLLDEINSAVQDAKFVTGVVEIAPMALYNALRYNYADAEGCTLLVDIGSRTTNLLFCEPGKIFPRRLNIGGSTITTALSKDLQTSYSEADQRKVDDGFVSLGGSYAEPDDVDVARISKIIRNQMTRLHQEIARSITFYRSEHGGTAPSRVLLAGGTASLAYMREFFQEKFSGMEVDYFNPLRNVSVAPSLDVEQVGRDAHTLGEVVGLALRSAVSCPMELNLRPASVVTAERISSQRPFMIAAGLLVFAGLASWWQYHARAAAETRKVTVTLTEKARPLQADEKKIKGTRDEIQALQDYVKPLVKAVEEREYWSNAIADLNSRLPVEYIWITSFQPPSKEELKKAEADAAAAGTAPGAKKKPGAAPAEAPPVRIMVKGVYLSRDAGNNAGPNIVDEFAKNLQDSPFFEPILKPEEGYMREADDTQKWGFGFAIPLQLKQPIELK
jgi:type IV pilus assembly protein PilM